MHHSYIAFAIPFFLFFMGLEYWYSKRKGKNFFQFAESVANINVGIAERLMDVFTVVPFYYFFEYIHSNYAIYSFKENGITWILLFLCTDVVWYWYHRLAHKINILWAAHIVHHQSEDFNYTVSARITLIQASIRCLFWAILPLIGFSPAMISIFLLIHGIYPFFIHTQTVGKLGWIEKIFVTPSHHRVHHSSNVQYLDKNFGDVLIIWDKIFGSFVEEKETPVYGLTKPIRSYSFLWQHFHFQLELLVAAKYAKEFKNKCKVFFGGPEQINPAIRVYLERYFLKNKVALNTTKSHRHYIILQTALSLILLFCVIFFYTHLQAIHVTFVSLFLLISVINTGAILEQQSWIFYLEVTRLMVLLIGACFIFPYQFMGILTSLALLISIYYFKALERRYKKLLFA